MASLIGATFVFPGVSTLDAGTSLNKPPFLSGLGPVFLVWLTGPLMTLTLVTTTFLILRTLLLRGEDPFHKVLWVRAFAHVWQLLCGHACRSCIFCQHLRSYKSFATQQLLSMIRVSKQPQHH